MSSIFGEKLKLLREQKGLKQKELGDILNYVSSAISNYETGRNEPSMSDLCKIADYFDVSIDYLAGREERNTEVYDMIKNQNMDDIIFWRIYKGLNEENKKILKKYAEFLKKKCKKPCKTGLKFFIQL